MLYHSHTESIVGSNTTGFSKNNDLVFSCNCSSDKLYTPLYKENYLEEFNTELDKASVRNNLGITNSSDLTSIKNLLKQEILKELNKPDNPTDDDKDPDPIIPDTDGFDLEDWGKI